MICPVQEPSYKFEVLTLGVFRTAWTVRLCLRITATHSTVARSVFCTSIMREGQKMIANVGVVEAIMLYRHCIYYHCFNKLGINRVWFSILLSRQLVCICKPDLYELG